jgi:phosphatidylglycerol---prolipoprotein diacylglyceryl transferase
MFDAYGIHLGPLYFRYYGMIIMAGAVAGTFVTRHILAKRQKDPELVWDGLIWALVFGIIGARLWHVFTPSQSLIDAGIDTRYYLTHPLDILLTWNGGLGMPGAILGGAVGLYIFARRRKLAFLDLLDAASPAIAIGQAVGRWGNFVNQELYGPPTDLPWAIPIRPENRIAGFEAYERFHPLFLYESLWNALNAVLLYFLWKRYGDRLKTGDLFLVYLIAYPLGRFLLEFLRLDYVAVAGINLNQTIMLVTAVVSAGVLAWRYRKPTTPAPAVGG